MHRNEAAHRFHMEIQPAASGDGGRYAVRNSEHSMTIQQENIGMGHIFCVADTFDDILRELSPAYFKTVQTQLASLLAELGIAPRLAVGWMHRGYACTVVEPGIPGFSEPAGLFGWVTQSHEADWSKDHSRLNSFLHLSARGRPFIKWATCEWRLFRFKGIELTDYARTHDAFVELAIDEPSEWSGPVVVPERQRPTELWRRLVFAAATNDQELENQAWMDAEKLYSQSALMLLRQGIENTRKCGNW